MPTVDPFTRNHVAAAPNAAAAKSCAALTGPVGVERMSRPASTRPVCAGLTDIRKNMSKLSCMRHAVQVWLHGPSVQSACLGAHSAQSEWIWPSIVHAFDTPLNGSAELCFALHAEALVVKATNNDRSLLYTGHRIILKTCELTPQRRKMVMVDIAI